VPVSSVDSYYDNIKDYSDLSKNLLDKIAHFFSHYKDLEKGKAANFTDTAFAKRELAVNTLRNVKPV
jgi:inorganic pyrophosphatase